MHGQKEFIRAIDRALQDTNFDQDVKVQVFEGMLNLQQNSHWLTFRRLPSDY